MTDEPKHLPPEKVEYVEFYLNDRKEYVSKEGEILSHEVWEEYEIGIGNPILRLTKRGLDRMRVLGLTTREMPSQKFKPPGVHICPYKLELPLTKPKNEIKVDFSGLENSITEFIERWGIPHSYFQEPGDDMANRIFSVIVRASKRIFLLMSKPINTEKAKGLISDYIRDEMKLDPKEYEKQILDALHWMSSKADIPVKRYSFNNKQSYYWGPPGLNVGDEIEDDSPDEVPEEEDKEELRGLPEAEKEDKKYDTVPDEIRILKKKVYELGREVEKLQTRRKIELVIEENGKRIKIKETVHEVFGEVLFQIKCGYNPLVVGPSGCGKTELAIGMAKHLHREFGMLSLSGGVTETKLYGRNTPNINTGKSEYQYTQFVKLYEKGGLFLLDEVDGGDPNVLLSLNGPLSNKVMTVDRPKNPIIEMHKNFVCIAAANTWGTGADRQYVGRNQLDGAFLKRFVILEMDYDKKLEYALCPGKEDFVERMHSYRANMMKNRVERVIDTRFIVRAYNWYRHKKDDEYVDSMLFKGWREDEIRKVKSGY